MSRYIDADLLLAQCRRNPLFEKTEKDKGMIYIERSIIDAIPTADVVEVRHGHWKYLWLDAVCSECGYINEADTVTRCRSDPPYCPKCGAKMDGKCGYYVREENTK